MKRQGGGEDIAWGQEGGKTPPGPQYNTSFEDKGALLADDPSGSSGKGEPEK